MQTGNSNRSKSNLIILFIIDFLSSKASLYLQMLIYFERIYAVVFFFFEIILYIFKSMFLVYPPGNIATEIVGLFFMVLLQYVKLNNANTANKTELKAYHFYTLLYLIPVAGCYVFYFYFQVYCLTFDVILSCIGFFFTGLELIFSFVEICTIKS